MDEWVNRSIDQWNATVENMFDDFLLERAEGCMPKNIV
jgi:hypothetical protein